MLLSRTGISHIRLAFSSYEFGAFQNVSATLEVWVSNFTLKPIQGKLELSYYDLKSETTYYTSNQDITLPPNQSLDILTDKLTPPPLLSDPSSLHAMPSGLARHVELDRTYTVVVHARFYDMSSEEVLARATNWPEPFKYTNMPDPGLMVTVEGEMVSVEVKKPAKCVFFSIEGEVDGNTVKWSDNALDLFPGDRQVVGVKGLGSGKVMVSRLGQEKPAFATSI